MDTQRASAAIDGGAEQLTLVVRLLDERRIAIDDIGLRRPTLDDVFLALTGPVPRAPPTPTPDRPRTQPDPAAPMTTITTPPAIAAPHVTQRSGAGFAAAAGEPLGGRSCCDWRIGTRSWSTRMILARWCRYSVNPQ